MCLWHTQFNSIQTVVQITARENLASIYQTFMVDVHNQPNVLLKKIEKNECNFCVGKWVSCCPWAVGHCGLKWYLLEACTKHNKKIKQTKKSTSVFVQEKWKDSRWAGLVVTSSKLPLVSLCHFDVPIKNIFILPEVVLPLLAPPMLDTCKFNGITLLNADKCIISNVRKQQTREWT